MQQKSRTPIPKPGQPVRGSRSGAPVMALFDLLGRRWAMGVLWSLAEGGPTTFRGLQERCETISPAALNQRLKELQEALLVHRAPEGYEVTPLGLAIYDKLVPLGALAKEWGRALEVGGGDEAHDSALGQSASRK
ncbi:helix-turn-helix domain-containing protein [Nitratireductor rhodophyticola]|uniref:winged helix-turn-helix transcriptional regulator n=1 Tax=Nitratireductor rhodophyticola TaxID=2854036 RepID=UPI002AC91BBC|nr:helix-turn-helix domain-containing protein [Nitratireductor rhodophyticola]WPZ15135.1 helix-turn-helix domain-containing protein [Nitratireductor rhodophyticola]